MHVPTFSLRRFFGCVATVAVAMTGAVAADDTTDLFADYESYIKVSGQKPKIKGNAASYAKRYQTPESGSAGIEAIHYAADSGKNGIIEFDGRALVGAEDYLAKLRFSRNELGSFEIGYKQARTFYDGIGGFFPLNSYWKPLTKPLAAEELHTDRGTFWMEANITVPNAPVYKIRYVDEKRVGRKDTTIWGDTDFSRLPTATSQYVDSAAPVMKLVPSFIDLDEHQKTLEAIMTHTVGKTSIELSIARNTTDNTDTRWVNRYPGELRPLTAPPSTSTPPALANNAIYGFDTQINNAKVMTYTGKFETTLNDKISFFGGITYQDATADIGGDRQMTIFMNTNAGVIAAVGGFTANGRPPYSYKTVAGKTAQDVLTANLGVSYKPIKDLQLSAALRREDLDMSGSNQVTYLNTLVVPATGAVTNVPVNAPNTASRTEKSWTPEFNLRYTGIRSLPIYATVDYKKATGDEIGSSTGVTPGGGLVVPQVTASSKDAAEGHMHYKVGANWVISPMASLRAETFLKEHTNRYTGYGTSLGSRFDMGYNFRGTKFTAAFKPLAGLSFTTRYIHQRATADVLADHPDRLPFFNLGTYDAMSSKSHIFGQTIDWAPCKQFYMQANLNVVYSTIITAYPSAGGLANDVLRNADNNYWNGNIVAGMVLGDQTNAQLEYTVYRSNNFVPSLVNTPPYGASASESVVMLTIKHSFTAADRATFKLGYVYNKVPTTGHFTNYRGLIGYLAFEHAL